ncbi:MAG: indolepyruvate ferredoxin oxidoreductase subunit alpha [Proteobacteria bacterium]|nr:indolepyruvate ferredoxin oxidoreductase subunit alpha [Pseudomonadota bacterium]
MKVILTGNEAIARGAYEAGVAVATAYPGTPSTEILENLATYEGVYAEWSPNEKVALEVATGAAIGGCRALAAMKHVGVNVAADPLFTVSYTGIKGGLVIVTADDPEMHSSQNEQDNRNYAKFAKVPMLEPADSQEAKDYVKLAFELSERFDTPVFVRTTTRVSHSKSIVELSEPQQRPAVPALEKQPSKYVMVPAHARKRHPLVEQRIKDLEAFAEEFAENRVELQDPAVGIIASGTCYQYAREAFPGYSFLKLGMVYPLPKKKIKEFARQVKKLYAFEELDPFFEEQVKALGIEIIGKEVFPSCGEFDPGTAEQGISGAAGAEKKGAALPYLPPRPPTMCPGCPHRGLFYALNKLKVFVAGDIGCYTLACLPPLKAVDTCICMGASIGHAMGLDKALGSAALGRVVAVIGDSTFLHSGITGLLDVAYNRGACTIIILDNWTTAMTGRQDHPGTGMTIREEKTTKVDYVKLVKALGIKNVKKVDPFDLKKLNTVLKKELNRPEPSVIITDSPCVLYRRVEKGAQRPLLYVESSECIGCKACLQLGCPALEWVLLPPQDQAGQKKKKGEAFVNPTLCTGCELCSQLCRKGAIRKKDGNN